MPEVLFARLEPEHFAAIDRQPSQRELFGAPLDDGSGELGETLAAQKVAWCALHEGRIAALFGIAEQFQDENGEGVHGVAWSILASGIGAAHLAVTRRARRALAECGLARVELIARAADAPRFLRGRAAVEWCLDPKRITPECLWAGLLGFEAAHVLHRYGARSETHMLYEWFGPPDGAGGGCAGHG